MPATSAGRDPAFADELRECGAERDAADLQIAAERGFAGKFAAPARVGDAAAEEFRGLVGKEGAMRGGDHGTEENLKRLYCENTSWPSHLPVAPSLRGATLKADARRFLHGIRPLA